VVIDGPQLTVEQKDRALSILGADPRFQQLIKSGATVDANMIMPLEVVMSGINSETGEIEEVHETWAQVWIDIGNQQKGDRVDLVRGEVVSIEE